MKLGLFLSCQQSLYAHADLLTESTWGNKNNGGNLLYNPQIAHCALSKWEFLIHAIYFVTSPHSKWCSTAIGPINKYQNHQIYISKFYGVNFGCYFHCKKKMKKEKDVQQNDLKKYETLCLLKI